MGEMAWRILTRQWGWMLLFFVVVTGAVTTVTLLTPKAYGSEAKLLVRLGRENATLDATAALGRDPVVAIPASRETDLGSVMEIIRSHTLLEEVAAMVSPAAILGKGDPTYVPHPEVKPGDQQSEEFHEAVRTLAKGLSVELIKKSSVIGITYEGPSPKVAQAVVAAIIERAIERNILLNRNPRVHEFVVEQTTRLNQELTAQEQKLASLKREMGVYLPEAERQAAVNRMARLRDELLQTQATLASVREETERTQEQLATLPANQTTAKTTGLLNASNDPLRTQLVTLEGREQELRARYGAGHPEARLLREQAEAIRLQLVDDEKKNPREQIVLGPNRVHEELRLALLRSQAQQAGLQARQEQLTEQIREEQTALGKLDADALRLNQQMREVELLTLNYRKYAESLEQVQMDRELETEKITNLAVAQPATYAPIPIRPRLTVNLGAGLGLGLVGALALGWLLESLRPRQTEPGVPVEQASRNSLSSQI